MQVNGLVYGVNMEEASTADRILKATYELFDREGADAVTMRRVAKAVGVTPMAIYRHFSNREELLKKSARTISGQWQEACKSA